MDRKTMEELVAEQRSERKPMANISRTDETHFSINNHEYELVSDPEKTFDEHEFIDRFSTALSRYDYIVGDWGFGQLRLKGFLATSKNNSKSEQISALQDYLFEYCNYGAGYFVLYNKDAKSTKSTSRRNRKPANNQHKTKQTNETHRGGTTKSHANHQRSRTRRKKPYVRERVSSVGKPVTKRENKVDSSGQSSHRHFVIREKETQK